MTKPMISRQISTETSDQRAELRAAHRALDDARAQCYRCQQTERSVRELLLAATEKLSELGDIDDLILQYRASKLTAAAQGGPTPDLKLPDELAKRLRARDEAREEAAASNVAHDRAFAELTAAERTVQKYHLKVSTAATEVLLNDRTFELAAELRTAWNDLWRLTDELNALGACWFAGINGPQPVRLPSDAIQLLQHISGFDTRQFAGGRNREVKQARERWIAWHKALLENADAAMPEIATSSPAINAA